MEISSGGKELRLVLHDAAGIKELMRVSIEWRAHEWHQVALTWSPDSGSTLYLDGIRVAEGPGIELFRPTAKDSIAGFCMGSDEVGQRLAQGLFEEVYTFNRALSDWDIAKDYERTSRLTQLGPISAEEEQAWLVAATVAAATRAVQTENIGTQYSMGSANYGCNLWLEIGSPLEGQIAVTLHNTGPGRSYRLWRKTNLNPTSWEPVEDEILGASGQDWTQVNVAMSSHSAQFFRAETLAWGFKGLDWLDSTGVVVSSYDTPADTMGAVGPCHFVEHLNSVIIVYDKQSGVVTAGPIPTKSFFGVTVASTNFPTGYNTVDPRIFFDHQDGRWIASAIDALGTPTQVPSRHLMLAVSKTDDPSDLENGWDRYVIPIAKTSGFTDFDTLGVDANGIYFSVVYVGGAFDGSHSVIAIPKAQLYQGSFNFTEFFIPSSELDANTIEPVINYDSLDHPELEVNYAWFVSKGSANVGPPYEEGGQVLYRALQWTPNGPEWVGSGWIPVGSAYRDYYDLDGNDHDFNAPQAGVPTKVLLSSGLSGSQGSQLMNTVIRNGKLWTCQAVGLDGIDGDYDGSEGGHRTAIQWIRFDVNTANGELDYDLHGRVYDTEHTNPMFYYFPSITVNRNGDMVMGFSGSSSQSYASAYYYWRKSNGTSAAIPQLIREGDDPFGFSDLEVVRLGDYSFTTLDPADGLTVWTVQEYADEFSTAEFRPVWGTWIACMPMRP